MLSADPSDLSDTHSISFVSYAHSIAIVAASSKRDVSKCCLGAALLVVVLVVVLTNKSIIVAVIVTIQCGCRCGFLLTTTIATDMVFGIVQLEFFHNDASTKSASSTGG